MSTFVAQAPRVVNPSHPHPPLARPKLLAKTGTLPVLTVNCVNNSGLPGTFCIYQINSSDDSTVTLAWLTLPSIPNSTIPIFWPNVYGLEYGQITSGSFKPGSSTPYSVTPGDMVKLSKASGSFNFTTLSGSGAPNTISVVTDGTLPVRGLDIALCMAGFPYCAFPEEPNLNMTFTLKPKFYLTFAPLFTPGQVLDISKMTNSINLDFQGAGVSSFTAAIDPTNNWTLTANF